MKQQADRRQRLGVSECPFDRQGRRQVTAFPAEKLCAASSFRTVLPESHSDAQKLPQLQAIGVTLASVVGQTSLRSSSSSSLLHSRTPQLGGRDWLRGYEWFAVVGRDAGAGRGSLTPPLVPAARRGMPAARAAFRSECSTRSLDGTQATTKVWLLDDHASVI